SSTRLDFEGREFGTTGFPEIRIKAHSFNGVAAASSKLLTNWLSVGASAKYLYAGGIDENIGLNELMTDDFQSSLQDRFAMGQGISVDAGMTAQWQTKHLDFRVAAVASDIGQTK